MRPLADRMRPVNLDDYAGQEHLVKPGAVLRKAIENGRIHSFILWGPPGVGKTTLAKIIANQLKRPFYALSAINSGVKDVRETIQKARSQRFFDQPNPILFIDEIHRFSKSQQDSLLGAVEQGIITLIGATTENPSFEVISALLSRCQVYTLEHLEKEHLLVLLTKAIQEDEMLKLRKITLDEAEALLHFSGGDARKLYNALEIVVNASEDPVVIKNELVERIMQQNMLLYDKAGDQHYDMASAFIKSIRGSDPNAAVYWLARMIEGGEDEKFICRRMIISAAEDIGLANPNALLIANQAFQAVQVIGFPEARIIMSEAAIYLACSPKSNSAYLSIKKAQDLVRKSGNLPVPMAIRNAPTSLMEKLNYGKGYAYAHDYQDHFVDLEYLPSEISGSSLYTPLQNPAELKIKARLEQFWKSKYKF